MTALAVGEHQLENALMTELYTVSEKIFPNELLASKMISKHLTHINSCTVCCLHWQIFLLLKVIQNNLEDGRNKKHLLTHTTFLTLGILKVKAVHVARTLSSYSELAEHLFLPSTNQRNGILEF